VTDGAKVRPLVARPTTRPCTHYAAGRRVSERLAERRSRGASEGAMGTASRATLIVQMAAVTSLLACGRDSQAAYVTVADSAGIALVEHDATAVEAVADWQLGAMLADIRQDESDSTRVWTRTIRAFWVRDGIGLLVSDPPHVRVFGNAGDQLQTLGQRGDGPGELRGPTWAAAVGDSIVVRHRPGLTMFGSDGAVLRTQAAPSESYEILGRMGDSWLFAGHIPKVDDHAQPDLPDPATAPGFVVALGPDGQLSDPIVQFEKLLTWRVPVSLWGTLRLVATDGSRVYAMHPTSFQVTAYDGAHAVRIVRAPVPHFVEFTESHFEVTREVWGPIADRMIESDREAGRLGVPPAVSMFFAEDGDLWVRRPDDGPFAEDRVWDVFDKGWHLAGDASYTGGIRDPSGSGRSSPWHLDERDGCIVRARIRVGPKRVVAAKNGARQTTARSRSASLAASLALRDTPLQLRSPPAAARLAARRVVSPVSLSDIRPLERSRLAQGRSRNRCSGSGEWLRVRRRSRCWVRNHQQSSCCHRW
jgi:hypothetical protein